MAVPKKRRSKSKKRALRSQFKIEPKGLTKCSNCGALIIPHRACSFCGFYKGKQVVVIKEKQTKEST